MYIGGLYIRRARRGEKLMKKKLPFLGHLSPKVYTHYVCFPPFLFPGDFHDSLDILWQPCPEKKSLATSPPKGSHIYTHFVCFFSFLFPRNLHDSLDILWQPLRKSDNLCGSLAIPSQVYEHKGLNMM